MEFSICWLNTRGVTLNIDQKNKNVLELLKNHFKDVKKVSDFTYVRGGGGRQLTYGKFHMFLQILFESFPKYDKVC